MKYVMISNMKISIVTMSFDSFEFYGITTKIIRDLRERSQKRPN